MTTNSMRELSPQESELLDLVRERTKLSSEWRQVKKEAAALYDRYLQVVDRKNKLEESMRAVNSKIIDEVSGCDEVPAPAVESTIRNGEELDFPYFR